MTDVPLFDAAPFIKPPTREQIQQRKREINAMAAGVRRMEERVRAERNYLISICPHEGAYTSCHMGETGRACSDCGMDN